MCCHLGQTISGGRRVWSGASQAPLDLLGALISKSGTLVLLDFLEPGTRQFLVRRAASLVRSIVIRRSGPGPHCP